MRKTVKVFLEKRKEDLTDERLFRSFAVSMLICVAFTLFNGFLGIYYLSVWNGTMCVYYALLAAIRGILARAQRKSAAFEETAREEYQRRVYGWTHLIMLCMNLSLLIPIALLIQGDRAYTLGIIPAIAMAAYTAYRITMSIRHYRNSKTVENLLVREIRTVNLIDSLLALLTLQNTMIQAVEGEISRPMKHLSIATSGVVFGAIIVLTILSFLRRGRK